MLQRFVLDEERLTTVMVGYVVDTSVMVAM